MVFIRLWKPNKDEERSCLQETPNGNFNYKKKFIGCTEGGHEAMDIAALARDGFVVDHVRERIGKGSADFTRGVQCLKSWGQFQLPWARVDTSTLVQTGQKVCVSSKVLFLWTMNPLEILYSKESSDKSKRKPNYFNFGHGTLAGHFLAGEERFSVEWAPEDNSVWYSILTISKPANVLSVISYPLVRHLQSKFRRESVERVRMLIEKERSDQVKSRGD